jgi:5'-methylthioadenosine phosphorylase
MIKIGIIGGSGMEDPNLLQDYKELEIETNYGKPSSKITSGKISGVEVFIISRHGKKHEIPPSEVNYRANIAAFKKLGCTHIIASSAVGSLRQNIEPGDLVFPDQMMDFTKQRKGSFYDKVGEVVHTSLAEPFSKFLREELIKNAEKLKFKYHKNATIVVIEGPRFSTRAESFFFRNFADIIGMTTFPECALAKEAGLEYASIAMSTDYDCWKEGEEAVTFEIVKQRMSENASKVKQLLVETIKSLSNIQAEEEEKEILKKKIRTIPNWPKPGVMFRDITTLLKDGEGFKITIDLLEKRYKNQDIDVIAGIESRGFVVASALASRLGKGVVLIRKPGKLPAETIREEYLLEYGKDAVEIHKDAISSGQKVLLVDDLLATGGTALAACNLIKKLGGQVEECAFIIDLPALKGREKLARNNFKVFAIVEFEGE